MHLPVQFAAMRLQRVNIHTSSSVPGKVNDVRWLRDGNAGTTAEANLDLNALVMDRREYPFVLMLGALEELAVAKVRNIRMW
jgi:hypothetical protein